MTLQKLLAWLVDEYGMETILEELRVISGADRAAIAPGTPLRARGRLAITTSWPNHGLVRVKYVKSGYSRTVRVTDLSGTHGNGSVNRPTTTQEGES